MSKYLEKLPLRLGEVASLRAWCKPTGGSMLTAQWDHKEILGSGPWVPDCFNGKIQSFFAESGPFPDHFFNFSGLLVVIFIQIVKKGYKM